MRGQWDKISLDLGLEGREVWREALERRDWSTRAKAELVARLAQRVMVSSQPVIRVRQ